MRTKVLQRDGAPSQDAEESQPVLPTEIEEALEAAERLQGALVNEWQQLMNKIQAAVLSLDVKTGRALLRRRSELPFEVAAALWQVHVADDVAELPALDQAAKAAAARLKEAHDAVGILRRRLELKRDAERVLRQHRLVLESTPAQEAPQ